MEFARWQFLEHAYLAPLSYNQMQRFNKVTGNIELADIRTDEITGVPGITVREWFWLGFGDQCSLTDQIVLLLLNKAKGLADPISTAVKQMPDEIVKKYYPYFLNMQNFTGFHTFSKRSANVTQDAYH